MMKCPATHTFSTDAMGTLSLCELDEGHHGEHVDEHGRWWSASQPRPMPNASTPIVDLVIDDLRGRDRIGRAKYGTPLQAGNGRDALRAKYGTPLQAGNGRDALRDAYEEALDLAQYLRQALEERDGGRR